MKKKICLNLIMLLAMMIAVTAQQPSEIFSAEELTSKIDINSVMQKTQSGNIDDLNAYLMFFPKQDDFMKILEFTTEPESSIIGDKIIYNWKNPKQNEIKYGYKATLNTKQQKPEIYSRINFPIEKIENNVIEYTKATKIIDSENPKIKQKSNELIQGKTDLYETVTEIAKWVKDNTKYDLGSLTAQASQTAGWVLENKKGVCDEITSLFIALLRAQGIPAKFISGIAYTNSPEFPENWGPHGWAEVYFPGKGWIPYDVTFGEFGWLDAGHIKMMESKDPQEASTKYEWKGNNADIKIGELNIKAETLQIGKKTPTEIKLSVEVEKDKVSSGSYNLIKATVENMKDYYITTEVALAKVEELEEPAKERRTVILKPNEKKIIAWKIKVKNNLDDEYLYKVPVMIYTIKNETAQTSFGVAKNHPYYDLTNIDKLAEGAEKEEIQEIDITCKTDKETAAINENINLYCEAKNIAEQKINGESCFEECQKIELQTGETKKLTKQYSFNKAGKYDLVFKIDANGKTRKAVTSINIIDKPTIKITEFSNTQVDEYKQNFKIKIKIEQESFATPQKLKLKVKIGKSEVDFDIGTLDKKQEFIVDANSASFLHQEQEIELMMAYEDELGKTYTQTEQKLITLKDVNFWDTIQMFFARLF